MKKFKTMKEARAAYEKIERTVGMPFEQWLFDQKNAVDNEPEIDCAADAATFINYFVFNSLRRETFWVCPLNAAHKPLCAPVIVSEGLLNGTPAGAREVFRSAIWWDAAAIIVAHNHPSGDPTPSNKDIVLTEELIASSKVLCIPLLDHIILGRDRFVSLKEDYEIDFQSKPKNIKSKKKGKQK